MSRTLSLVATLCAAQVAGMAGFAAFPALVPTFQAEWGLSNTEAGWISGIYYAGYLSGVPVLVSLTDRVDPRRIYLISMGLTGLVTLGFALFAEGFWTATRPPGSTLNARIGASKFGSQMRSTDTSPPARARPMARPSPSASTS